MGYLYSLTADRDIEESDVISVIKTFPEKFRRCVVPYKQSWGWIMYCDVHTPVKNHLIISGSYSISGEMSKEFTNLFAKELEKKDYKIEIKFDE